MKFPDNFTWGVAAAAYQIEGAWNADGKGASVWDVFAHTPGKVWSGHTGDDACDHYNRFKDDVAIMKKLGVKAYRLSISWPRVFPQGTGSLNLKGLSFYNRLVDALLKAGIEPWVTLFHWDYPYELYCRGGWLNRDSADWFAEYAKMVADVLSDRVSHWMTLNEPTCFIGLGHLDGIHAPGDKLGLQQMLRAGHHALLAHGKGVQAIRAASKTPATIGYAPAVVGAIPASDDPADIHAARADMFSVTAKNTWNNTWWMDPVFKGKYPEDGLKLFGAAAPEVRPGDLETIHQPLDFCGANIYNGRVVKAGKDGKPEQVPQPPGAPITAFHWPITPACLYWGPKFLADRYKQPVYITENGMSNADFIARDGKVHDPQRIDFLCRYLRELGRAIEDGVDVRGYFHWSIMDNFEWAEGYKQRFGLVHVDYATQTRTIKDSGIWYTKVIKTNGEHLDK